MTVSNQEIVEKREAGFIFWINIQRVVLDKCVFGECTGLDTRRTLYVAVHKCKLKRQLTVAFATCQKLIDSLMIQTSSVSGHRDTPEQIDRSVASFLKRVTIILTLS